MATKPLGQQQGNCAPKEKKERKISKKALHPYSTTSYQMSSADLEYDPYADICDTQVRTMAADASNKVSM